MDANSAEGFFVAAGLAATAFAAVAATNVYGPVAGLAVAIVGVVCSLAMGAPGQWAYDQGMPVGNFLTYAVGATLGAAIATCLILAAVPGSDQLLNQINAGLEKAASLILR